MSTGSAGSWRSHATQQAQDDLDGLLNFTLPFAKEMLDDAGEFYPYAAAVDESDEVRLLSGGPDLGEHPGSDQVLAVLLAGLRNERLALRAVAVVADVRLEDTDAVRVELEHRDGHALEVYLPYRKKRFLRGVDYDELSVGPGRRRVWTA